MIFFDGNGNRVEISGGEVSAALQGTRYFAAGDSIVEIQSTNEAEMTYTGTDLQGVKHENEHVRGYLQDIEDRYGVVCENRGLGGHRLTGDYAMLVAQDYTNVALFTIGYGTNDARSTTSPADPLGTADSTDFSTFSGALSNILRKVYMDNPSCKVVVLTPPQRLNVHEFGSFTKNNNGDTLEDFANMIVSVAHRRSTRACDIFHESGLNQVTLYKYSREGVHPLNEGYKMYSNLLIPIIDQMLTVETKALDDAAILPASPASSDSAIVSVPLTEDMFTKVGFEWDQYGTVNAKNIAKQVGKGIKLEAGKTYLFDYYSNYNMNPNRYLCVNDNGDTIEGSSAWGKGVKQMGFSDPKEEIVGGESYYKLTAAIAVPKDGGPYYLWPMRYNALGVESLRLRYF